METLGKAARYCLISTRIAKFNVSKTKPAGRFAAFSPDKRTNLKDLPVAYLLDEAEANNDSTNYWIFSDAGLRRLLQRTNWDICDYMTAGNTTDSDPASADGDERAFCLVKSRLFR